MILICEQCLYTFAGDTIPLYCPDCGAKNTTRPAEKEEIEDYKRMQRELAVEKYILDYVDFTFSPFIDLRGEPGQSGPLLLATHKTTGKKFIVKHTEPADAPNEFVAGYIAEMLGFPNPKVYLFAPGFHSASASSSSHAFKYPAVAIEYMDGLEKFEMSDLSPLQAADLIHQTALTFLCFQEDQIQMNMWNGRVISYDYAESFSIENKHVRICEKAGEEVPVELLMARDRYMAHPFFAPDSALRILGWSEDRMAEVERIYYDGLLPLLNIDEDELFDILAQVFPDYLVGYYDACLFYMKEQLRRKLSLGT